MALSGQRLLTSVRLFAASGCRLVSEGLNRRRSPENNKTTGIKVGGYATFVGLLPTFVANPPTFSSLSRSERLRIVGSKVFRFSGGPINAALCRASFGRGRKQR